MTVYSAVSPVAPQVKSSPEVKEIQEMWVLSLGWDNPLEKGMATHSGILAWRISKNRGAYGLQSMGSQRVGHY